MKTLSSLRNSEQPCKQYDPIKVMNDAPGKLTGYDCEKCKNKGVIYMLQDGYEVFRECECMKIRESIRRIKMSGLKEALEKCTFKSFEVNEDFQRTMFEKAMAYIKNYKNNWFFLGGQPGCGKTHICTAIVRKLLVGEGKVTRYLQWRDEVPKIKAKANTDEYEEMLTPWKTVEVLYIDDFFKTGQGQRPTTADVNIAFEILNYRYQNSNLTTIISSELKIGDIIKIDEAVGRRIFEKAKNYCFNIDNDIKKNYSLKGLIE